MELLNGLATERGSDLLIGKMDRMCSFIIQQSMQTVLSPSMKATEFPLILSKGKKVLLLQMLL